MFGILILYLSSPGIPKILDIIIPLNESRPRIFLYETEYFIDQDKYYFYILIHAYMTVPVSLGIIVFFDNVLGTYIHHATGMFEIVRFIDLVESTGTIALLFVVGLNTLIITVTGMSTVMKIEEPSEAFRNMAFTIGGIFHLFYNSHQGNLLMSQSKDVFEDVYSSEWYTLPPSLQKLLIPIMMRAKKPSVLTAGGLYVLSNDSFSLVLRKAMSFFTVLNSAR
ncbi:odorant receptor 49b-like [Aphidius gifuensis]|uniref:odorant receptor 49b-like n=1 Tax=Aphidius gifuensis TaxID=684658 RepID=UPI001CDC42D6|nr:odorant receptor 49b-like [Aphidius gifuensis]